ncbi:MAG: hypothetical protein CMC07_05250 [Flavobacteriaceae bacterium]|nr:hypothetical protein [Flavobacteriaceae bacterium]|tara:strand:- start:17851 stop:18246 length:396 start_codon:yes stop_codon:yes gene_type:complete
MKNSLILIVLFFGMNLISSAQEVSFTKPELEGVLCKQWKIEYAMMNEMKIEQMPGAADFDILFIADGSYDLIRKGGDNKSGTWVYDTVNKYIKLSIEEKTTSHIKSINHNKMILTLVSEKLPGVKIYFKPI